MYVLISNVAFYAIEINMISWFFLVNLSILILLPLQTEIRPIHHKKTEQHRHKWIAPTVATVKRYDRRRGVNIGLVVKVPTTQQSKDLDAIEKEIETIEEVLQEKKPLLNIAKKISPIKPLLLKPAFECDQWDPQTRTCWLDRNTGDTVTFSLSTGFKSRYKRPDIVWKREFAQKGTRAVKEFTINSEKTSRNLVIGRRGYELRVSPVTELDIDDNQFSASFSGNTNIPQAKVNFRIRIVPEDLGFVYIGETLDLAIESFVSLPLESMGYHWYTEKEGGFATLPSNMRVSQSGETLRISELRQEQEGIVACSIYSNKNIHVMKKRFLIKELTKNRDVLKNFSSHDIPFEEKNLNRPKKTVELKEKQTAHTKAERIHHKAAVKSKIKHPREIDEANVDGDSYKIIQSNDDATYNKPSDSANGKLYSAAQNAKRPFLSFGNTLNNDTIVNIDLNPDKNFDDDKVAQIVSYCTGDLQCSKHATCIRTSLKQEGFCRCLHGFYGSGIFCREEM